MRAAGRTAAHCSPIAKSCSCHSPEKFLSQCQAHGQAPAVAQGFLCSAGCNQPALGAEQTLTHQSLWLDGVGISAGPVPVQCCTPNIAALVNSSQHSLAIIPTAPDPSWPDQGASFTITQGLCLCREMPQAPVGPEPPVFPRSAVLWPDCGGEAELPWGSSPSLPVIHCVLQQQYQWYQYPGYWNAWSVQDGSSRWHRIEENVTCAGE